MKKWYQFIGGPLDLQKVELPTDKLSILYVANDGNTSQYRRIATIVDNVVADYFVWGAINVVDVVSEIKFRQHHHINPLAFWGDVVI